MSSCTGLNYLVIHRTCSTLDHFSSCFFLSQTLHLLHIDNSIAGFRDILQTLNSLIGVYDYTWCFTIHSNGMLNKRPRLRCKNSTLAYRMTVAVQRLAVIQGVFGERLHAA